MMLIKVSGPIFNQTHSYHQFNYILKIIKKYTKTMASFIVCMFNHVLFFNLVDGMEVLERERERGECIYGKNERKLKLM